MQLFLCLQWKINLDILAIDTSTLHEGITLFSIFYLNLELQSELHICQSFWMGVWICNLIYINFMSFLINRQNWKSVSHRSFLTVGTLHNPLVFPSFNVNELLTNSADHRWLSVHWNWWGVGWWHFWISRWRCSRNYGGRTLNKE